MLSKAAQGRREEFQAPTEAPASEPWWANSGYTGTGAPLWSPNSERSAPRFEGVTVISMAFVGLGYPLPEGASFRKEPQV